MTLRVPRFIEEPRHVFPPVELSRQSLPGRATLDQPIVVDCFNSPPHPGHCWSHLHPLYRSPCSFIRFLVPAILGSPHATEEARACSPARSKWAPSPPDTRREPQETPRPQHEEETDGSPDVDVLFLSADHTPKTFSPSLLSSPPSAC